MRLITNENSSPAEFEKNLGFVCEPVNTVTDHMQDAAIEMLRLMYQHNAIGLAANQVGLRIRLCVIDPAWMYGKRLPIVLFNPEIVEMDEDLFTSPEGCLSLPGLGLTVPRFRNVRIKYLGLDRKEYTIKDDNSLLASVLQHELDHLDGVLFTERVFEDVNVEFQKS